MATITHSTGTTALPRVLGRIGLMAAIVAVLALISTPLRSIDPLQLRIATNILFFAALGMLDEWLLAPALNRWPLLRTIVLVIETLVLGWFFSPGRVNPASRFLFYTHIAPFFVAVFGGALLMLAIRFWRRRA